MSTQIGAPFIGGVGWYVVYSLSVRTRIDDEHQFSSDPDFQAWSAYKGRCVLLENQFTKKAITRETGSFDKTSSKYRASINNFGVDVSLLGTGLVLIKFCVFSYIIS